MQQQIGVWTTGEGSTTALIELGDGGAIGDDQEWKIPSWVSGALQGAAAGAATGAAAGPYGALIGAAAGGAIGAATSSSAPAPAPASAATPAASTAAPPATTPPASGDAAARANVVAALQQFAAIVPTLVQLVASSGKGGKELGLDGEERLDDAQWGAESLVGTWSIP